MAQVAGAYPYLPPGMPGVDILPSRRYADSSSCPRADYLSLPSRGLVAVRRGLSLGCGADGLRVPLASIANGAGAEGTEGRYRGSVRPPGADAYGAYLFGHTDA